VTAKELKLLRAKAVWLRDGSVGNPVGSELWVRLSDVEALFRKHHQRNHHAEKDLRNPAGTLA
jgi:hypothetical protein